MREKVATILFWSKHIKEDTKAHELAKLVDDILKALKEQRYELKNRETF